MGSQVIAATVPQGTVKLEDGRLVHRGTARASIFDLDKMERRTEEKPYETELSQTPDQFLSKYDAETAIKLIQLGERRHALLNAKSQIVGADATIINKFIAPWRSLPMFELKLAEDVSDEVRRDAKKAQTAKIMSFVRETVPVMWEQLKQAAELRAANPEDTEDNQESEEEA